MILEQETLTMKDLSLFLLKNAFGAKMRKGFRNFCNGDSSTSILDQQKLDLDPGSSSRPLVNSPSRESHPTLEEMIFQLEMEEKLMGTLRQNNLDESMTGFQHRRSCVNSSDILRTARKALNQYPRFSLDGKDAMYRSSFTNLSANRVERYTDSEKIRRLPAVVGGENVIWCKPGIVAKLMGLEAMPIPLNSSYRRRERLSAIIRRQNLRRKAERHEMERRRLTMVDDDGSHIRVGTRSRGNVGSCSRTGYCFMKPVQDLEFPNIEDGWPMRQRFL